MDFPKVNKKADDLLSKEEKNLGRSKAVYINLLTMLSLLVALFPHFASASVDTMANQVKPLFVGKMTDAQQIIRMASQQFNGFDPQHADHESHESHYSHSSHESHYSHYSSDSGSAR